MENEITAPIVRDRRAARGLRGRLRGHRATRSPSSSSRCRAGGGGGGGGHLRRLAGGPAGRRGLGGHAGRQVRPGRPARGVGRRDAPAALLARRRRALHATRPARARALARAGRRRARGVGRGLARPARGRVGGGQRAGAARRGHPRRAAGAGGGAAAPAGALAPTGLAYVLHEPEAGVLHAARGVRALVERAQEPGRALEMRRGAAGRAARCGSASGCSRPTPWSGHAARGSGRLFPELVSLRVTLQQLALFEAGPEWAGAGWVDFDGPWYGHGAIEPHGFKVAHDVDGPPVDPDARPARGRRAGRPRGSRVPGHALPRRSRTRRWRRAPACHYSLTRRLQLPVRRPPRPARACGCWAAARDTASSTGPPWPSTWPPCWAAARRPSHASRSASAGPGAACARRGPRRRERAAAPAAAGARHRGHAGLDRGPGAAPGGDRTGSSTPRSARSAWRARCWPARPWRCRS